MLCSHFKDGEVEAKTSISLLKLVFDPRHWKLQNYMLDHSLVQTGA